MTYDWKKPVMSLLNQIQQDGLRLTRVNDGCDGWQPIDSSLSSLKQRQLAAEVITSVDEAHIVVSDGNATATLFIVLGNEPEELVADIASASDSLMNRVDDIVSRFGSIWEGKPCPTV
jgi:hypothetical protein